MAALQAASAAPLNTASLMGGASAAAYPDCPPLFSEALEKIAEACIPQFEKVAGPDMTIACVPGSISLENASQVITTIDPVAVTAFFNLAAPASRLLVSLDYDLVQLVIELMCGGMCSEAPPSKPRPGTGIDRQFARVVFNLLAATIEAECQAFGIASVKFGQIETKLDPSAFGKRNVKVCLTTFTLGCRGRSGSFRIVFPQGVVDGFKQDRRPAGAEAIVSDPVWTEHFQSEIGRTAIKLDAYLEANGLSLGDIANLQIGQILPLPKAAPSRCELRQNNKVLFRCELGQADGRYSLRIEDMSPSESKDETPATFEISSLFNLP